MEGRRERQKRRNEARILRAAARLFEAKGYEATSMKDVARRAGLAVGTLYNYFDSKPDLVLALVRRDADRGLTAGEAVLKRPPGDPVEAVLELLERELAPFARHDRGLWRELLAAALREPRLARGLSATDLRLVAQIAALLRELAARGDLRDDLDTGRGALAIYAVFFTWFALFATTPSVTVVTVRSEVRLGVALVMRGLLAPSSDPDAPHREDPC